jgi:hypothetical protein
MGINLGQQEVDGIGNCRALIVQAGGGYVFYLIVMWTWNKEVFIAMMVHPLRNIIDIALDAIKRASSNGLVDQSKL